VELSTLHAQLGSTMIYVTHDQVEAMTMASRIVVLNAGKIEQVGTPLDLYHRPANRFVAGFLGAPRMNFLEAEVVRKNERRVTVRAPGLTELEVLVNDSTEVNPGDKVTLGIRPEKIRLCAEGAAALATFGGTVRLVEHLGRETVLYADASPLLTCNSESGTRNVTVQVSEIASLSAGERVMLGFNPMDVYLFSESGSTLSAFEKQ
jgi:multiple sugar transport system ATP-binding protein